MRITIAGTGNVGTAMAADLTLKGHQITMMQTSGRPPGDHLALLLSNGGVVQWTEKGETRDVTLHAVTTSYREALSDPAPELIVLCIQTNFHEPVLRAMAPYLNRDQMLLLEPGYLGSALALRYAEHPPLLVEAESSPIDCRITAPGKARAYFRNVRDPIGVYPADRTDEALERLRPLAYPFTRLDSVVEAALHNPNLIVHTIGAIMSIPRIEYTGGEYWMYREVFTPSVWNLVRHLDAEKSAVLSALGLDPMPYLEACRWRNAEDLSQDPAEVFHVFAQENSVPGPDVPDSRYITEDVPEGLVLLESLGRRLGIPTPVCGSLIDIASACLDRPFRPDGRTLERLGSKQADRILADCPGAGS